MRSFITLAAALLAASLLSHSVTAEESAALPLAPSAAKAKVQLEAVVAYGAVPFTDPIQWTIIRPVSQQYPEEQILLTQTAVSPTFDMAPGRYIVRATHSSLTISQDLIVPEGSSKHTINFNAGNITLSMIPHTGAGMISSNILWEVYEYRKGGLTDDAKIASAMAPSQHFMLAAGAYVVRASYNGTTADLVIPLDPGRTYKYTINLYAGTVGLSAVSEGGGSIGEGVVYQIYKAAIDKTGERPLIGTYNGDTKDVLLREGSYLLIARGNGLQGEIPFVVSAGENAKIKVMLKPTLASSTATSG
ncbi:MAG: hypothetical protein WD044_07845 [Dongiaceae bacterium]